MKKQDTNRIRKIGYVFCNTQGGSVYDSEYISATISACTHGWGQGYIVVEEEYILHKAFPQLLDSMD